MGIVEEQLLDFNEPGKLFTDQNGFITGVIVFERFD